MSEPEESRAISVSERAFNFLDRHPGIFVISLFVWLFVGCGAIFSGRGLICFLGWATIVLGICSYIYWAYFSSWSQSRKGQEPRKDGQNS
jgi:hypothetical protein